MYRFSPGDHYALATYGGFFEDQAGWLERKREIKEAHDAENERREDEGLPSLEEEAAADAAAAELEADERRESEKGWWAALPPVAAAGVGIGGGVVVVLLLMAIFGGRK